VGAGQPGIQPCIAAADGRGRGAVEERGDGRVAGHAWHRLLAFLGQLPVKVLIRSCGDDAECDYEPGGQAHRPECRG
jgi:hypothetical protein